MIRRRWRFPERRDEAILSLYAAHASRRAHNADDGKGNTYKSRFSSRTMNTLVK